MTEACAAWPWAFLIVATTAMPLAAGPPDCPTSPDTAASAPTDFLPPPPQETTSDASSLRLSGWLDMGYTYASSGAGLLAVEPQLNRFGREFLLNQAALELEKPLRPEEFSTGFFAQFLGGADAADLQGPGDITSSNPRFGGVIRQLYVNAHLPALGDGGVDLVFGRQGSRMGYESYMPHRRSFYSLSYQWFYAEDGADTGLWTTWHVTPQLDAIYGVTMGSNTFFTWQGHAPSHLLQVNYWLHEDKKTLLSGTLLIGDEAVGKTNPANPGSLATVLELRVQHAWSDRLTQFCQANLGWDQSVPGVGLGEWYGVQTAGVRKISAKLDGQLRLEWFDDVNGTRTGFATNYVAVTAAATWRLRPWLLLRPELRGDAAGADVFGTAGNPGRTPRQLTAALECLLRF